MEQNPILAKQTASSKKCSEENFKHMEKMKLHELSAQLQQLLTSGQSLYIWMWELDHKEGWVLKNWCFWTVVLEKTLESPLNCNEIKSVNPKGNQFWIFIGRTDAEAKAPVLWLRDSKSRLISKDPDAEKDWRQEEKGTTEDEMVEWPHDSMDMSLSELLEMVKDREVWHAAVYRVAKSRTQLRDWISKYQASKIYKYISMISKNIKDFKKHNHNLITSKIFNVFSYLLVT